MTRAATARPDPALKVTVASVRPMMYAQGADLSIDRPFHVRAGSGVVFWSGRLAVVQDDAAFVALVDTATALADALPLPVTDGVRLFSEARGNKRLKPDLESVLTTPSGGLIAFGSGSTPMRNRVLLIDAPGAEARWAEARSFYRALQRCEEFSGSELNVEGATVVGDRVRFFQRGNGAAGERVKAVDATCEVSLDALTAYLARCERDPNAEFRAELLAVTPWDLGTIDGVRLTFTDGFAVPGLGEGFVAWLGAAERSPDTYNDGPCVGVALGWMRDDEAGWAPLLDPGGQRLALKAEGLCVDPKNPAQAWAVVDHDDPTQPSLLLDLRVEWP